MLRDPPPNDLEYVRSFGVETFASEIAKRRLGMLEVRLGPSDRSHENTFFRHFASHLKINFDENNRDGILIGMSVCKGDNTLKMDALLITDGAITIIDFKNYGNCDVYLPEAKNFDKGAWHTGGDQIVRGGSSNNPYAQLMNQKGKLKDQLSGLLGRKKIGSFPIKYITTMVCFTGNVTIHGSIPKKLELTFFIADAMSFLERVYDITNVKGAGILESDFCKSRVYDLLEAPPYECDMKPGALGTWDFEAYQAMYASEKLIESAEHVSLVEDFCASDGDVLIITSTDLDERMRFARTVQERAHIADFVNVPIFTTTKLVGQELCSDLQLDGSLYSEIYDSRTRTEDEDGIEHIGLGTLPKGNNLPDPGDEGGEGDGDSESFRQDDAERTRTLFIVCESQLVTSDRWEDDSIVFGSGRLLPDLLDYLEIDGSNKGKNKVVFIGDRLQLSPSSPEHMSLCPEAYPSDLGVWLLPSQGADNDSAPKSFSDRLVSSIRRDKYSLLCVDDEDEGVQVVESPKDRLAAIESVVKNWQKERVVVYENETALQLNLEVKSYILKNGENLNVGDVLIFNGQFDALICDTNQVELRTRTIRSGDYAIVTYVGGAPTILPAQTSSQGASGALTLLSIRFKLRDGTEEYEANVIKEFLESPKPILLKEQDIALRRKLAEMEREAFALNPFSEGNPWFNEMIREGEYAKRVDKTGREIYRQKDDQRKLTPQEKAYRQEILARLHAPGTLYHQIKNAAKARYGWAITAHKTRVFLWDSVMLYANTSTVGHYTGQYFKYLYTAACHAKQSLSILHWDEITPFDETKVDIPAEGVQPSKKKKNKVLFTLDPKVAPSEALKTVLNSLQLDKIEQVGYSEYQVRYKVVREGKEVFVTFSYNKNLEVTSYRMDKGDKDAFDALEKALDTISPYGSLESPMDFAYRYLESKIEGEAKIKVCKVQNYRDEVEIVVDKSKCMAATYYNSKGFVSRIELRSGDRRAFDAVADAITGRRDD